jgi:predicted transposase YdaD
MRCKHVLKGLASASLVTAALALSGPAVADLNRLEREVREEGREEARQHDRMEREIRQEGKQKGWKLDRRL